MTTFLLDSLPVFGGLASYILTSHVYELSIWQIDDLLICQKGAT
jgi:hypothetical protein